MSYKTLQGIVPETLVKCHNMLHEFQHEPVIDNLITYSNASYLA